MNNYKTPELEIIVFETDEIMEISSLDFPDVLDVRGVYTDDIDAEDAELFE